MSERFGYDDIVAFQGLDGEILARVLSWRADRSAYGVMTFDGTNVYVVPADQLRLVLRRGTLGTLLEHIYDEQQRARGKNERLWQALTKDNRG